jgi:hypothetical protein
MRFYASKLYHYESTAKHLFIKLNGLQGLSWSFKWNKAEW